MSLVLELMKGDEGKSVVDDGCSSGDGNDGDGMEEGRELGVWC